MSQGDLEQCWVFPHPITPEKIAVCGSFINIFFYLKEMDPVIDDIPIDDVPGDDEILDDPDDGIYETPQGMMTLVPGVGE